MLVYIRTNVLFLKAENKLLIVQMGGLEPLIRQMLSPNVEVQCNAVGCITNLATHGNILNRQCVHQLKKMWILNIFLNR